MRGSGTVGVFLNEINQWILLAIETTWKRVREIAWKKVSRIGWNVRLESAFSDLFADGFLIKSLKASLVLSNIVPRFQGDSSASFSPS